MEEFVTIQEAMKLLKVSRATLYNYLERLGQETHKFESSRQHFVSAKQVEAVKLVQAKPWKLAEVKQSLTAVSVGGSEDAA